MQTSTAQRLEVGTRRRGVEFRNIASDGPHLKIGGVNWQLPSRAAAARPKFVDGKPTFTENTNDFPAAEIMVDLTPEVDVKACPTCGHTRTAFDVLEQQEWALAAVSAAAECLQVKYELSDEQLSDLLTLEPDSAIWLVQLNQWAQGEPTNMPQPVPFSWLGDMEEPELPEAELDPLPIPKPTLRQRLGRWLTRD